MCSLAVQSTCTHTRSGGGSRAHSSDASTWAGAQLSLPAPSSGRCLLRGTCAGGCRRVPSGHRPQRAWVLSLDLICQPDGRGRGSSSSLQGRVATTRVGGRTPGSPAGLSVTALAGWLFFFLGEMDQTFFPFSLFLSETSGGCATLLVLPLGENICVFSCRQTQRRTELGPRPPRTSWRHPDGRGSSRGSCRVF